MGPDWLIPRALQHVDMLAEAQSLRIGLGECSCHWALIHSQHDRSLQVAARAAADCHQAPAGAFGEGGGIRSTEAPKGGVKHLEASRLEGRGGGSPRRGQSAGDEGGVGLAAGRRRGRIIAGRDGVEPPGHLA